MNNEYPKALYHKQTGRLLKVNTATDEAENLAGDFQLSSIVEPPAAIPGTAVAPVVNGYTDMQVMQQVAAALQDHTKRSDAQYKALEEVAAAAAKDNEQLTALVRTLQMENQELREAAQERANVPAPQPVEENPFAEVVAQ